jgi:hypothetical protein
MRADTPAAHSALLPDVAHRVVKADIALRDLIKKFSPSGVRTTLRVVVLNSVMPSDRSRSRMWLLTAGCDRFSRSDAARKLNVSPTAIKHRILVKLTFMLVRREQVTVPKRSA